MSEEAEAKRDGARLTKNSGRGNIQKGDAVLPPFCIDYKEYDESFSVSRKNWAKLRADAWRMKMFPAFKLVLGSEDDAAKLRVWVIDDDTFHDMREAWVEKYG